MAQSKPCVICLTPVTNNSKLRCCGQPCHAACAQECRKKPILTCPSCQHVVPLSVLPPSNPCVICLTAVPNHATLRCCDQPCHPACAMDCDKPNPKRPQILNCPSCQHAVPLSVIDVLPGRRYSRELEFMEQVEEVWKNNRWWYGTLYENENVTKGYWAELRDPYDANRETLYFLGHTKSQVIPRMKTCISFL